MTALQKYQTTQYKSFDTKNKNQKSRNKTKKRKTYRVRSLQGKQDKRDSYIRYTDYSRNINYKIDKEQTPLYVFKVVCLQDETKLVKKQEIVKGKKKENIENADTLHSTKKVVL